MISTVEGLVEVQNVGFGSGGLTDSLRHDIFVNIFKTNKDKHFKLGTLDLIIVNVI